MALASPALVALRPIGRDRISRVNSLSTTGKVEKGDIVHDSFVDDVNDNDMDEVMAEREQDDVVQWHHLDVRVNDDGNRSA